LLPSIQPTYYEDAYAYTQQFESGKICREANNLFKGAIDELRIENTIRSPK
jgi:hypothetical protein